MTISFILSQLLFIIIYASDIVCINLAAKWWKVIIQKQNKPLKSLTDL